MITQTIMTVKREGFAVWVSLLFVFKVAILLGVNFSIQHGNL